MAKARKTPTTETEFGARITKIDAQKYFDAQARIQNGKDLIKKQQSSKGITQPLTTDQNADIDLAEVYNSSQNNAFIFKKELVMELLNTRDKNNKFPEYLMIHYAAKFEDNKTIKAGEPTLVILGCNKVKNSKMKFTSMDLDFPADEQPGKTSISKFPSKTIVAAAKSLVGSNVIEFTLK